MNDGTPDCSNCGRIKGAVMVYRYIDKNLKAYKCKKCGQYEYELIEK